MIGSIMQIVSGFGDSISHDMFGIENGKSALRLVF